MLPRIYISIYLLLRRMIQSWKLTMLDMLPGENILLLLLLVQSRRSVIGSFTAHSLTPSYSFPPLSPSSFHSSLSHPFFLLVTFIHLSSHFLISHLFRFLNCLTPILLIISILFHLLPLPPPFHLLTSHYFPLSLILFSSYNSIFSTLLSSHQLHLSVPFPFYFSLPFPSTHLSTFFPSSCFC